MRTPVIIPAYQEEFHIGPTLRSLPRDVEPFVAVNGSSDRTADIAREFGAHVLDLPEQGKMPAIQATLKKLGKDALGPVLILDGDSRPLFPRQWHDGMVMRLTSGDQVHPKGVGAPIWFIEGHIVNGALRSLRRAARAVDVQARTSIDRITYFGPNMGLHLRAREVLDTVLSLPHYWPGEDKAMVEAVISNGGTYTQTINPALVALTPFSESFLPLLEVRKIGQSEARNRALKSYTERGATGSVPYSSEGLVKQLNDA